MTPTFYDSERYQITRDRTDGLTLRRNADGASVYFRPGDEAAAIERQVAEATERSIEHAD